VGLGNDGGEMTVVEGTTAVAGNPAAGGLFGIPQSAIPRAKQNGTFRLRVGEKGRGEMKPKIGYEQKQQQSRRTAPERLLPVCQSLQPRFHTWISGEGGTSFASDVSPIFRSENEGGISFSQRKTLRHTGRKYPEARNRRRAGERVFRQTNRIPLSNHIQMRAGSSMLPGPSPAGSAGPAGGAARIAGATASASTPASSVTAAAFPIHPGPGFGNVQGASFKLGAIQAGNRFGGSVFVVHPDKSKSARLARIAVRDDADPLHGSKSLKKSTQTLAQVAFRSPKRQIPYKQIFHRPPSPRFPPVRMEPLHG